MPDGPEIPYTLTRARRRTLAIHIHPDGEVEVRAPLRLGKARIEAFVREKAPWIRKKQAEAQARAALRREARLEPGQTVTLLGQEYRLVFSGSGSVPGPAGEVLFLAGETQEELRQSLAEACRAIARDYFPLRAEELAKKWGFSFQGVSVTGARTRWGSCSGKNHLNFSFRLCWASPAAADYVILHELAHTREHNHSPRFWAIVEGYLPDYRRREEELRQLHKELSIRNL